MALFDEKIKGIYVFDRYFQIWNGFENRYKYDYVFPRK